VRHDLRAIKNWHANLLLQKQERDPYFLGDHFWEQVIQFIGRARMLGRCLRYHTNRWAVQSLLDYWANALYRARGQDINALLEKPEGDE
jgi:hypothetical protein